MTCSNLTVTTHRSPAIYIPVKSCGSCLFSILKGELIEVGWCKISLVAAQSWSASKFAKFKQANGHTLQNSRKHKCTRIKSHKTSTFDCSIRSNFLRIYILRLLSDISYLQFPGVSGSRLKMCKSKDLRAHLFAFRWIIFLSEYVLIQK